MDEPTEGIQPNIVEQIEEVIRKLRDDRNISVLLIEQFLDFASGLADEYCVLDGGVVSMRCSAIALDRAAVTELLAV